MKNIPLRKDKAGMRGSAMGVGVGGRGVDIVYE